MRNGAGERSYSYCIPRVSHIIRAKVGAGPPVNMTFVERWPTGKLYTPELAAKYPGRDWILTRILWLSGCEIGFNRLGGVYTTPRIIYLDGSPDSVPMGEPGSIDCIRMHNNDLLDLFGRV